MRHEPHDLRDPTATFGRRPSSPLAVAVPLIATLLGACTSSAPPSGSGGSASATGSSTTTTPTGSSAQGTPSSGGQGSATATGSGAAPSGGATATGTSNGAATTTTGGSGAGQGSAGTPASAGGTSRGGAAADGGAAGGGTSNAGAAADGGMASDAGAGGAADAGGSSAGPSATLDSVLVFSRTAGFRHDSINAGLQAITALGAANDFDVTATEDATTFSAEGLSGHDVVVWLNTTGDVLDDTQQSAFESYVRAGGGWVGVHSASDTEYDWAWYGELVGGSAYFKSHPAIQTASIDVEISDHPSTAHLPARLDVLDEWYNFTANPRGAVNVLMKLDETSYSPGADAMGDHPIAWFHEFDGGRAWYTALGHRIQLYSDARFVDHLLGGIRWAAGVAP